MIKTVIEKSNIFKIDKASIYFEVDGTGHPILFIHAGVADSRQWNSEFEIFASQYQVIRYDLRGFGKSKPVEGQFSHLQDLTALVAHLQLEKPLIMIGCSMGGRLALDFTLANPDKVCALIMVDSAPSGLKLDVQFPEKFKEVKKAEEAHDLDLVAELEIQIWFDGERDPSDINQDMRKLAYEMNRLALSYESMGMGDQIPDTEQPAIDNIDKLNVPLLVIIGAQDIPYMHAALAFMTEKIPNIETKIIDNAAHLPNMDQPLVFQNTVMRFLSKMNGKV